MVDSFNDLVLKNRSYRRFDNSFTIQEDILLNLIELTRFCPSSRNQQALRFMPVCNRENCDAVFQVLAWAGYLKDWIGPSIHERPSGYIIILGDTQRGTRFDIDLGICAQTLLLGAVAQNLGGCMIGSIRKPELQRIFSIPEKFEILLVIALGKPVETVVIESMKGEDVKYWRDSNQVHHVPKRSLDEILISENGSGADL